jgi:hypothetical protein
MTLPRPDAVVRRLDEWAGSVPFPSVSVLRRPTPASVLTATACATAGAVLLVSSYHHAAGLSGDTDQLTFALYWAGYLVGFAALALLATAVRIDESARVLALVGFALFGTLPKLLRAPTGPLDSDEYVHLRQIIEAYLRGDVGHPTPRLPIAAQFPGFHQAVSAVAQTTGLSLWTVALGVVLLAHVLSVVAVYQLVRALGATAAGAATGAVVYSLNPSWVDFDASVAYESLAVPLLLWCLAAVVAAGRSRARSPLRHVVAAVSVATVLPLVHHLTTLVLCAVLVALSVAALVRRTPVLDPADGGLWRERRWPLLVVTAWALVAATVRFLPRLHLIMGYLGPSVVRGSEQLGQLVGLAPPGPGARVLFGASQNPLYEVVSGLLFPVVVLGVVLVAGYFVWRNRREAGSAVWVFAALASLFFLSLPLLFTPGGSEGAHRSWAFSFIGIAVVTGLGRSFSMRSGRPVVDEYRWDTPFSAVLNGLRSRDGRAVLATLAFVLLAVGGTAASHENVSGRFPGAPRVGDDARAVGPEGAAVTAWIAAHAPVDTPVLASRYASFDIGSYGRMATVSPSARFPVWDLFVKAGPVSPAVLVQLYESRVRYIVVDWRMATVRPALGYWFTVDEPGAGTDRLYPAFALDRFNCLPWLRATYGAGPLTVYQVDRAVLIRTLAGQCPKEVNG